MRPTVPGTYGGCELVLGSGRGQWLMRSLYPQGCVLCRLGH